MKSLTGKELANIAENRVEHLLVYAFLDNFWISFKF